MLLNILKHPTEDSMDAMETLLNRRSIRNYKPVDIPSGLINELLKAAMYAPSASNQQPWHFVVISDRKVLDEIPKFHPYASMTAKCPSAIVICADTRQLIHPDFWVQDCSAATENLLLAAHAKGLGAVWVGLYPREERKEPFRKLLGLPEGIEPFSLIPIGVPAEQADQPNRFLVERIHLGKW